jgi:RHH-type proline utilization regulon transcriptional repressor/proline dehydrogenase/delta 1-pyrroline-5-carboxylate dehydrogenase
VALDMANRSALGLHVELTGPVGEQNLYALHPRGRILLAPLTAGVLLRQVAATLATGNEIVIDAASGLQSVLSDPPPTVAARISWTSDWKSDGPFSGALVEGDRDRVKTVNRTIANLPGPLVLVQSATTEQAMSDPKAYCLNWLLEEVSTSINTAAAGGNASLMTIG